MSDTEPQEHANSTSERAFRAIVSGETIQTAVAQVDALVEESHVRLNEDGIQIPAVDPAGVSAVSLGLERTAFEAYEGGNSEIGINLSRLSNIVNWAETDQLVEFVLDPAARTLGITIGELEYTLGLIVPDSIRAPLDISEHPAEFTGEVVVAAEEFDRAIRAADMVTDHLALGIDADSRTFSVEAEGDTDDVSVTLSKEDCIEFTPGDAHSLFSLDYLTKINRAIPRNTAVRLRVGNEAPLGIQYEFADGTGTVEYLVSPRIAR